MTNVGTGNAKKNSLPQGAAKGFWRTRDHLMPVQAVRETGNTHPIKLLLKLGAGARPAISTLATTRVSAIP
jgi:hypothetical protein